MPVGGSAVGTLCFVSINPSFLLPSFRCDCVVWSGDRHIYESVRHAGQVLLDTQTPPHPHTPQLPHHTQR